jgi:hypothetical protein
MQIPLLYSYSILLYSKQYFLPFSMIAQPARYAYCWVVYEKLVLIWLTQLHATLYTTKRHHACVLVNFLSIVPAGFIGELRALPSPYIIAAVLGQCCVIEKSP